MSDALAAWSRLHGGYDPAHSIVVRTWLRLMHLSARPFVVARVAPDVLTAVGVLCAAVAVVTSGVAAAALVLGTAVFDGLDGAVAIQRSMASERGAHVDRYADRVTDALFGVVLWRAGASAWLAAAAVVATLAFELLRHRITDGGRAGIIAVTIGDRPFRVVLVVVGIVAAPTFCSTLLVGTTVLGGVHLALASASRGTADHVRNDRG